MELGGEKKKRRAPGGVQNLKKEGPSSKKTYFK